MAHICVPVLYLRAANDRLVLAAATAEILQALPQTELIELDGPHMLLQASADAAARAVAEFTSAHDF